MLPWYIFALVSFTTLALHCQSAALGVTVSYTQFQAVAIGTSQSQVTAYLGGSGTIIYQSGTQGSATQIVVLQYAAAQVTTGYVTFTFQGGVLISKSQFGLNTGVFTITQQQYTAISVGFTYAQVTTVVGTAGNTVSVSGTGSTASITVQYTTAGNSYGVVTFVFVGGAVASKSQVGFQITVSNQVTYTQFTAIAIGTTQSQVTTSLGGSGTIIYQSGTQGSATQIVVIQYAAAQITGGYATFTFQGAVLISKAQIQLNTGVFTITQQQYTTISVGFTYAQVTSVVGTTGNTVSVSGTGSTASITIQYTTAGNSYGVVTFVFVGGAVASKSQVGFQVSVSNQITYTQFTAIAIGTTQSQVTTSLGGSGTIVYQSGTQGSATQIVVIQYAAAQITGGYATLTFQGGVLISKTQIQLNTGVFTITQQQYTAISIGFTYAQVTSVVGTTGNIVLASGVAGTASFTVQYTTTGNPTGTVTFVFVGGVLVSNFQVACQ